MAHLLLSFHANHEIIHGSQVSCILTLQPTSCFPSVNLTHRRHIIALYHSYNYADRIFLTLRYLSDQPHIFWSAGHPNTHVLHDDCSILYFGTNLVLSLYNHCISHSHILIVYHPMETVIVIFLTSKKGLDKYHIWYVTRCDCDSVIYVEFQIRRNIPDLGIQISTLSPLHDKSSM